MISLVARPAVRHAVLAMLLLGFVGCKEGSAPSGGRLADISGSLDATLMGDVAVSDANANFFVARAAAVTTFFAGTSGSATYQESWSAPARAFVSDRTNDAGSAPVIDLWSSAGARLRHIVLDSLPPPVASTFPLTLVPGPGTAVALPGGRLAWTALYQGDVTSMNIVALLDSGSNTPRYVARSSRFGVSTCLVRDTSQSSVLVVGLDSVAGDAAPMFAVRELDAATGQLGRRIALAAASASCASAVATSTALYLLLDGLLTRVDRVTGTQRWQLPRGASGQFALSADGRRLAIIGSYPQPIAYSARILVVDTAGQTVADRQYGGGGLLSRADRDSWALAGNIAWSTDGARLLVALTGGAVVAPQLLASVVVLDVATGALLNRMSPATSGLMLTVMPMR